MVITIVDLDQLGPQLRKVRKAQGMTQPQLQQLTGFSIAYIIGLEQSKKGWTSHVIESFSKALKVNIKLTIAMDEVDYSRLLELKEE